MVESSEVLKQISSTTTFVCWAMVRSIKAYRSIFSFFRFGQIIGYVSFFFTFLLGGGVILGYSPVSQSYSIS